MDRRLHCQRLIATAIAVVLAGALQTLRAQENWRDTLNALNREIASAAVWSTDLHLRKAAANLQLQQWQYAIDEYTLILQKEAQNPAALFYRAYANTHLRRYALARADYQELLNIFPRHFEARLSLAYVLQMTGKQTEALDQLNQTVEQHPDSVGGYVARANLEQAMKQYDAAVYDWQTAIAKAPQEVGYVASLTDLLIRLDRRREARQVLDDAVKRGIPRGLLKEWFFQLRIKS